MCTISFKVNYSSSSELTAATATYRHKVTQESKTENILANVKNTVTLSDITVPGNYELTVKLVNTDNLTIYSSSTPFRIGNCENTPPAAIIKPLTAIQLPTNSSTLDGSGSRGAIMTYKWVQKLGPYVNIQSPNARVSAIIGMVEGTYKFTLTVTDAYGNTASSDADLTVSRAAVITKPELNLITQTIGENTMQIFEVGKDVAAGNKFKLTAYKVERVVIAEPGEDMVKIASNLTEAINKTTLSEWEAGKAIPPKGISGYPPTATYKGNRITITLDRLSTFTSEATAS